MNDSRSNLHPGRLAGLALVALLIACALPAGALAQDPSVDQYLPGTPDAGGDSSPDPVPNSGNPSDFGSDTDAGSQSEGGGGGGVGGGVGGSVSGSSDDVADSIAPAVGSDAVATIPTAEPEQNKAQRDLATIAASAEQQRETAGQASPDANPATELLRSDSGAGPGMGIFFWIVIGGTLAWAIGSGVIRNRQRDQTA